MLLKYKLYVSNILKPEFVLKYETLRWVEYVVLAGMGNTRQAYLIFARKPHENWRNTM